MTLNEARFVLANREMYDDKTYHYALEIVEALLSERVGHEVRSSSAVLCLAGSNANSRQLAARIPLKVCGTVLFRSSPDAGMIGTAG